MFLLCSLGLVLTELVVVVATCGSDFSAAASVGLALLLLLAFRRVRRGVQSPWVPIVGAVLCAVGCAGGLALGAWSSGARAEAAVVGELVAACLCLLALLGNRELRRGGALAWAGLARGLAILTSPVRFLFGALALSLIYWLLLPWFSLFLRRRDPLGVRRRPKAPTYFEPYRERAATLENLRHAS